MLTWVFLIAWHLNKIVHLYNQGGEDEPEKMVKELEVCSAHSHQAAVSVEDKEHAEDKAKEKVDAEDVGDDVAGGDEEATEGWSQGWFVFQRCQPAEDDQTEAAQYAWATLATETPN